MSQPSIWEWGPVLTYIALLVLLSLWIWIAEKAED